MIAGLFYQKGLWISFNILQIITFPYIKKMLRLPLFESSFSVISFFQNEMQDVVNIWIYKFLVTYLIFLCFCLMELKHIFPSKNELNQRA